MGATSGPAVRSPPQPARELSSPRPRGRPARSHAPRRRGGAAPDPRLSPARLQAAAGAGGAATRRGRKARLGGVAPREAPRGLRASPAPGRGFSQQVRRARLLLAPAPRSRPPALAAASRRRRPRIAGPPSFLRRRAPRARSLRPPSGPRRPARRESAARCLPTGARSDVRCRQEPRCANLRRASPHALTGPGRSGHLSANPAPRSPVRRPGRAGEHRRHRDAT